MRVGRRSVKHTETVLRIRLKKARLRFADVADKGDTQFWDFQAKPITDCLDEIGCRQLLNINIQIREVVLQSFFGYASEYLVIILDIIPFP